MTMTLIRDHNDALELVQDSMLKLVQKYSEHDPSEWAPLFYRILQNSIRDWHRKQKVKRLMCEWLPWHNLDIDTDGTENSAERHAELDDELTRVLNALQHLPLRQQQAFLLRAWLELSTRETAFTLSISENSVKTHYARATRQLRRLLGDDDG